MQMTFVGVGRGKGSKEGLPLRRPGETTTANMAVPSLIAAVHRINLKSAAESVVTLREVEELLKTQCQAEEGLR
jgi:EAL domain-containing protein (putative c-di-GMP-specific phosphodiesterase class I)